MIEGTNTPLNQKLFFPPATKGPMVANKGISTRVLTHQCDDDAAPSADSDSSSSISSNSSGCLSIDGRGTTNTHLFYPAHLVDLQDPGQPISSATQSMWLADLPAHFRKAHGARALPRNVDVLIIGSGISGASVAYHLCVELGIARTRRVLMVEARDACSGATGRNGGHMTAPNYRDFLRDVAKFAQRSAGERALSAGEAVTITGEDWERGREMAVELRNFDDAGVNATADFIRQNNVDCGLRTGSNVHVYMTEEEWAEGLTNLSAAREAGVIDKAKVVPISSPYVGATTIPGAHIFPARFVWYLLDEAVAHGLELHTHTPVESDEPPTKARSSSNDYHVVTIGARNGGKLPRTQVLARHVVHATNAWASHLLPALRKHIVPFRDQVIAIPRGMTSEMPLVLPPAGLWIRGGSEYAVECSHNGSLVLGGCRDHSTPVQIGIADDSALIAGSGRALRAALKEHPPLTQFIAARESKGESVVEWTGIYALSRDWTPYVGDIGQYLGHSARRTWISAGHCGEGMPRCFVCGKYIAQQIHAALGEESTAGVRIPRAIQLTQARLASFDFNDSWNTA